MKDKIIIAIDADEYKEAEKLVTILKDTVFFKVGLQSFLGFGDRVTELLKQKGKKLFLDLKFKDIPNTVFGAIKSVLKYDPSFLTIHLSGGSNMVKKALEAVETNSSTNLLGVTVLTSLDGNNLFETGIEMKAEDAVLKLVDLGISCGIKYFVCSPMEISPIRKRFGKDIYLVTPGIRPSWTGLNDQKRVFTPKEAIKEGSDYLVIGRPVSRSSDPSRTFKRIVSEIT